MFVVNVKLKLQGAPQIIYDTFTLTSFRIFRDVQPRPSTSPAHLTAPPLYQPRPCSVIC